MKTFSILLTILVALNILACGETNAGHITSDKEKEQLLLAIDKFNIAFEQGNNDLLQAMVTEAYLHTNGNSKAIRKEDWFNYLKKRTREISSGKLEVVAYKMEDVELEIYGKSAIVTAKIGVANKVDGKIQKSQYRVTNIWVNESGAWKRAGFHDGKINNDEN